MKKLIHMDSISMKKLRTTRISVKTKKKGNTELIWIGRNI